MPESGAIVLDATLEAAGWHHGFPLWSETDKDRPLVLAKGAPLSDVFGYGPAHPLCWPKDSTMMPSSYFPDNHDAWTMGSWHTKPMYVSVLKDERGSFFTARNDHRCRLKILLDTMVVRCGVAGMEDSEVRAQTLLRTKISENQWASYVLNGMFPETSPRSGVTYILRKGLPTIALRVEKIGAGESQKFLAALCLHPLAYYESTHVGCMPPTDDLITHLLMIRADERRYWAKAVHHTLEEPQSGI